MRSHAGDIGHVGLLNEGAAPLRSPAFGLRVENDPRIGDIKDTFAVRPVAQLYGRILAQYAFLVPEQDR